MQYMTNVSIYLKQSVCHKPIVVLRKVRDKHRLFLQVWRLQQPNLRGQSWKEGFIHDCCGPFISGCLFMYKTVARYNMFYLLILSFLCHQHVFWNRLLNNNCSLTNNLYASDFLTIWHCLTSWCVLYLQLSILCKTRHFFLLLQHSMTLLARSRIIAIQDHPGGHQFRDENECCQCL